MKIEKCRECCPVCKVDELRPERTTEDEIVSLGQFISILLIITVVVMLPITLLGL